MKIAELFEGKIKTETPESAFARYESLKKSKADPALLAKVLAIANSLLTTRIGKKMKDLESKFAGEGWWEDVKKMYKVEDKGGMWVVTSNARDWKQTKDWEHPTKYEADAHLEKLITYKFNDRKKGVGSTDKDYERIEKLTSPT